MAITFVGAGTQASGFGAPQTPGLPAGLQEGDFMVMVVTNGTGRNFGVEPGGPTATGWRLLSLGFQHEVNPNTVPTMWKIATDSESAPSVGYSGPVNGGWSVRIVAYRGVDPSFPIDAIGSLRANGSATSTHLEITTHTPNALIVAVIGSDDTGTIPLTTGSENGYTQRVQDNTGNGDNSTSVADKVLTSAGEDAGPSWDVPGPNTNNTRYLFALREEGQRASVPYAITNSGLATSGSTSHNMFLPKVNNGDLILLLCHHQDDAVRTFSTTGYTELDSVHNQETLAILYKVADGTETSVAVGVDNGGNQGGWSVTIVVYRNVDSTTPWDATAVTSTGSGSTFTPTGITTATDNARALSFVSGGHAIASMDLNTAQGFERTAVQRSYATSSGVDWGTGLAGRPVTSAGSVTAPTWSGNPSSGWQAITAAIRVGTEDVEPDATELVAATALPFADSGTTP